MTNNSLSTQKLPRMCETILNHRTCLKVNLFRFDLWNTCLALLIIFVHFSEAQNYNPINRDQVFILPTPAPTCTPWTDWSNCSAPCYDESSVRSRTHYVSENQMCVLKAEELSCFVHLNACEINGICYDYNHRRSSTGNQSCQVFPLLLLMYCFVR